MPNNARALVVSLLLLLSIFFLPISNASASNWQKYSGNPVLIGSIGGWDSPHSANPYLMFKDGVYKIWYQGSNAKWRIGYATSINGLDNWNKSSNPVIEPGSMGGWENEVGDPTVLFTSGKYKMWYSSINGHRIKFG